MTQQTCVYTITVHSKNSQSQLTQYVGQIGGVIKNQKLIEKQSNYTVVFTIQLTADKFEIPSIERKLHNLTDISIKNCELIYT